MEEQIVKKILLGGSLERTGMLSKYGQQ